MAPSTFFSIIYLKPYVGSDERLNLALLLSDGNRVLFRYSEERVQLISKLVGQASKQSIQSILHSVMNDIQSRDNEFFKLLHAELWSEPYLSYLSRYSNNLIGVTPPKSISIEVNMSNFEKLFEKWIAILPQETPKAIKTQEERLSKFVQTSLKAHTNINQKLTNTIVPGILFPFVISSIGMNDQPFVCEFLDFETHLFQAKNRINNTIHLLDVFSRNNWDNSTVYFVSNEPQNSSSAHKIWSNLREWGAVNVVTENEVGEIEEYLEQHHIKPFISTN